MRQERQAQVAAGIAAALGVAALLAFAGSAVAAGPPGGLDARAWELVSPPDKNGGAVGAPGTQAAGVLQAAAQGGALAFGSVASFGAAAGSLPVNQYLATRTPSGWSTENVTPSATPSGGYPAGAYELFSEDLGKATALPSPLGRAPFPPTARASSGPSAATSTSTKAAPAVWLPPAPASRRPRATAPSPSTSKRATSIATAPPTKRSPTSPPAAAPWRSSASPTTVPSSTT